MKKLDLKKIEKKIAKILIILIFNINIKLYKIIQI